MSAICVPARGDWTRTVHDIQKALSKPFLPQVLLKPGHPPQRCQAACVRARTQRLRRGRAGPPGSTHRLAEDRRVHFGVEDVRDVLGGPGIEGVVVEGERQQLVEEAEERMVHVPIDDEGLPVDRSAPCDVSAVGALTLEGRCPGLSCSAV